MSLYAENTSVPVERSKAEIERLLTRYGATQFASGWSEDGAMVGFRAHDRNVKFSLSLPKRTEIRSQAKWEQEHRRRWRSLALVIKAKLESVATGIAVFEDEFLAFIVLPGGRTVAEQIRPEIEQAYKTGRVPRLFLTAGEGGDQ